MCSSRKYPYPPPPFSRRATEGRGLQKEAISEGVGGCLQKIDFSADLSEIVELLINNSSSVEQTFSYFTATSLQDKYPSFSLSRKKKKNKLETVLWKKPRKLNFIID